MMLTIVFMCFLPIIRGECQEIQLISELNNLFGFDHNIFLVDSSNDLNRFINNSQQQLTYVPQSLFVYTTVDRINIKTIESKNPFLIVVPEYSNFSTNIDLFIQVREIQRRKLDIKIGVFFSQTTTNDDLQNLFQWFWRNRIMHVFTSHGTVATASQIERKLNIFNFKTFGKFVIRNVTGGAYNNLFLSQSSNFEQYGIVVGNNFKALLSPVMDRVWEVVFNLINASYVQYPKEIPAHDSEMFPNGSVDIKLLPATYGRLNTNNYLYPIKFGTQAILVPKSLPYPQFLSSLLVITNDNILAYSFLIVVATIFLLIICRYMKRKQILVFQTIADVVNLLINENGNIKYQKLSYSEALLIVPLTFVGFVIVNGILSVLQSHITKPFFQPQINTIEDIYQSDLVILVHGPFFRDRLVDALNDMAGHDWSERVRIQYYLISMKQARNFEHIAVLLTPNNYEPLLRAHKRLNVRGYQICRTENISPQLDAITVNAAFPFKERFNDIIGRVQSSGLYGKWFMDEISKTEQEIINTYNQEIVKKNRVVESGMDSMPIFIVYGWSVGTILFFIELIWKNSKQMAVKRFRNVCRCFTLKRWLHSK